MMGKECFGRGSFATHSWLIGHRTRAQQQPAVMSWTKSSKRVFSEKKPIETQMKEGSQQSWFQNFLSLKEMPEKYSFSWYREMVLLCTVFGITGSATMFLVRPAMKNILGLKGGLIEGPNSYRVASIVIMTPIYSTLLVCVGTVFGRHAYFRHFAVKMFTRFGIPAELMDTTFYETAKKFRKW